MTAKRKDDIREIDYGIAYQVTDGNIKYIEVNRHLKEDPILYEFVLEHERAHMDSTNLLVDWYIDLRHLFSFSHFWRYLRFYSKYPRSLLCISPIFITKNGVYFNWFALAMLSIMITFSIISSIFIIKLIGG